MKKAYTLKHRMKDVEEYLKKRRENKKRSRERHIEKTLEYNRKWNREHKTPQQSLAWNTTAKKLKRQYKCEVCSKDVYCHGHHHDYSKPAEVVWCCVYCHARIHSMNKQINNT